MIKLELTREEAQVFNTVLDVAVRARGLEFAPACSVLNAKLIAGIKAAEAEEKKK